MKQIVMCLCITLMLMISIPVMAGDIDENVKYYNSANGSLYLQPLADGFGAALNSGLYHDAKIEKFGLHFYLNVQFMGALITDDQKTFTSVAEEDMTAGITLPTVFGSEEEVDAGLSFKPRGAYETSILPIAIPQLTVGSFAGTELNFRFFQMTVDESIGDLKILGYGARHSLSQYVPLFPVDVAVSYFHQKFEIGNIVEANASYIGIQASKKVAVLLLYGGLGFESSNLNISYTYEDEEDTSEIEFDLDGKSKARFTLGVGLDLKFFKLHADYNLASQKTVTAGIGFGL